MAAEARLRGEVEEATLRVETMSRELEEGRVTWVQLEQSFNVKLHDAEQRHAETGRELTAKLSEEQLRQVNRKHTQLFEQKRESSCSTRLQQNFCLAAGLVIRSSVWKRSS